MLLAEWLAVILIVMRGPPADCNVDSVPVWAAFLVGGFIVTWPMYVARTNPGEPGNRRQIAIAQAFMACLLVHFSRGRYESQVAAVASFILVALYRDVRTLLLATGILAVDYVLGTFFWAEAIYGHRAMGTLGNWAWVRHIGRLTVEDVSLILAIHKSRQDLRRTALRTAAIEGHQAVLEREVAERQRTEGLLSIQYGLTRLLATSGTLARGGAGDPAHRGREPSLGSGRAVGGRRARAVPPLRRGLARVGAGRAGVVVGFGAGTAAVAPARSAAARGGAAGPGLEPPPAAVGRRLLAGAEHVVEQAARGERRCAAPSRSPCATAPMSSASWRSSAARRGPPTRTTWRW